MLDVMRIRLYASDSAKEIDCGTFEEMKARHSYSNHPSRYDMVIFYPSDRRKLIFHAVEMLELYSIYPEELTSKEPHVYSIDEEMLTLLLMI